MSGSAVKWSNLSGRIVAPSGGDYYHGSFEGFTWKVHFLLDKNENDSISTVTKQVHSLSGTVSDATSSLVEALALQPSECEIRFTAQNFTFSGVAIITLPSADNRVVFTFVNSPEPIKK